MARAHTFAHHRSLQNIQGREQCRGAVALVVECHRSASTFLHRQPRLRAVQGSACEQHIALKIGLLLKFAM